MKMNIRKILFFSLLFIAVSCDGNLDPYSERDGYDLFGFMEANTIYNQGTERAFSGGVIPLVYGDSNSTGDTITIAAKVKPVSNANKACDIQTLQMQFPVSGIVVGKEIPVLPENQILGVQYTYSGERDRVKLRADSGSVLFERFELLEKRGVDSGLGPYITARATFDLSFTLVFPGGGDRKIHLTKGVFDVVRPKALHTFFWQYDIKDDQQ